MSGRDRNKKDQAPSFYTAEDLQRDEAGAEGEAEAGLIASLEKRRGRDRNSSTGETYGTAVPGERPLMGSNVQFEQMYKIYNADDSLSPDDDEEKGNSGKKAEEEPPKPPKQASRLRDAVQLAMKRRSSLRGGFEQASTAAVESCRHRRKSSSVHQILDFIQEEEPKEDEKKETEESTEQQEEPFAEEGPEKDTFFGTLELDNAESNADRLVAGALQVQSLFEEDDDVSTASSSTTCTLDQTPIFASQPTAEEVPLMPHKETVRKYTRWDVIRHRLARRGRKLLRRGVRSARKTCRSIFHFVAFLYYPLARAYIALSSIPLFVMAWVAFYHLGNPHFDFMPGNTTLSWWLNFIGRQMITLELARICEWLLIDGLTLRTKAVIQVGGPLVTLVAIQSKGWSFVLSVWACIDLLFLHGDNPFPQNWFYWTGLEIYSSQVTGVYILNSETYLRVLIAVMLAGLVNSFKQTFVAIRFGRKTFGDFQPRMEKLLKEICLLAELAELSDHVEQLAQEELEMGGGSDHYMAPSDDEYSPLPPHPRAQARANRGVIAKHAPFMRTLGTVKWTGDENKAGMESSDDEALGGPLRTRQMSKKSERDLSQSLSRTDSGSLRIKDLLDQWEEPVNKLDRASEPSINEVLQFRRALGLMDEDHPFGDAYGLASKRDECIESAHAVYSKLMKFTPDENCLPYETLTLVASGLEGDEARGKRSALARMFRPDGHGKVSLLSFVQACDSLYRKLRYFRASVGNSSVLDHVLEGVVDMLFNFVLFLVILWIMNFNPWPLLVSMSTLVVSFSFAVGSSASRFLEGILLIAVRRPYDLGDRIIISGAQTSDSPGVGCSWLVEDINLYYTTLRFAGSNEVATIANGTLSSSRIVNCNRSVGATVSVQVTAHLSVFEDDKLEKFEEAVTEYVDENPGIWDSVLFVRIDEVDASKEKVTLRVAVRHRSNWHTAPSILRDKGNLFRAIFQVAKDLKIIYCAGPPMLVNYNGGTLKDGTPPLYQKDMLTPDNIHYPERMAPPTS